MVNSKTYFNSLLTMDEVLELFKQQYSKHTIYSWVKYSGMPHQKIKGKLWFPENEVYDWFVRSSK